LTPDRELSSSAGDQRELALLGSGRLAAIGELTGDLAHEINNPLFAILGLVDLLLKDAEPGTKAHGRLELIRDTGLEIKEIVRQVLHFARDTSDERDDVVLQEVVRKAIDLARLTSAAKGIELVEELDAEPISVRASRSQLSLVLLNLLTNAKQAMPDDGTITISLTTDDDWALLSISDTGPGVSDDVAGRVFEPFFTTKGAVGSGVGLTVGQTVARLHGGTLTLASQAGEGASFVLRLPIVGRS